MGKWAAFRAVPGVLLASFILILPASAPAEEAQAPPAGAAGAAEAPSAVAAEAPPAVAAEAPPGVAAEAPPAVAAEAPSVVAAEAPSVVAAEAPSVVAAEAPPGAAAEAPSGPIAPLEPVPAAAKGPAKASDYPNGLIHTVVAGDTLWDLSGKYLGSPWRWTELWERNRFLTNPHYIYPGIRVVVFPPPPKEYAMEVKEPVAEPGAAPAVPPPAVAAAEPGPAPAAEEPPQPGALAITPSEYVRAGEFLESRPRGIGRIAGSTEVRVIFAEGEKVVLDLKKDIPAGQLLGVYRVRGPVRGPAGRRLSGYVRYLVGLIQVTGEENGATVGVVRKSFEELTRTDLIAEDIPSYAPVVLDPGAEGLTATVIAGRRENRELAEGDFLFLDQGAKAGVARGNKFRLFRRAADSKYRVEVAQAVAVKVQDDVSTAYIVNSNQSFEAGVTAVRGEAPAR